MTTSAARKKDEEDVVPKTRTWDPNKSHDPDRNLDPRLESALSAIEKDAADRAERHQQIAREVAADWNTHPGNHNLASETLVGDLRAAIAEREREVYGKPTCPKCGSSALSLSKTAPVAGSVGAAPVGGDHATTIIRCNQCGYTPPA
jgi:DNA-directed RNA polymerase subunit M/transcription elongation factor TFIIS